MSTRLLVAAALVSIAAPALAQAPAASAPPAPQASAPAASPPAAYQASAASAPTLADQCLALLDGRVPANVDPVRLRPQCESLLRAGAGGQARAAASGAVVPQGESVRTAYPQPPPELAGPPLGVGRSAGISNTLTTNPIGWFSGLGVNAEYRRPLDQERFSYVVQGRFARAEASNGNVSTFGAGGGADMYLIGGRNAGLRLGPRFTLAFGRETVQGTSTFARLGAAAELGYDYIAWNGLTGSVAGGFGTRLAGDARNENFASYTAGETGPYVSLGIGYSW